MTEHAHKWVYLRREGVAWYQPPAEGSIVPPPQRVREPRDIFFCETCDPVKICIVEIPDVKSTRMREPVYCDGFYL